MASYLSVLIQAAEPANYKLNYDEHYMLSVPLATTTTPGIASFDSDYFSVVNGEVVLKYSIFEDKVDKVVPEDRGIFAYVVQKGAYDTVSNYIIEISEDADANTIARRYTNGRLKVGDGVDNADAVNKGQLSAATTNIPKSALASAVQTSLGKADTAYQKPDTGIPETDLSTDVRTKLNKVISRVGITPEAWTALPIADRDVNTMYFVGPYGISPNQYFVEWMYFVNNGVGTWEAIGSTQSVDFSNYYNKTDIDNMLSDYAKQDGYYPTMRAGFADQLYTDREIDDADEACPPVVFGSVGGAAEVQDGLMKFTELRGKTIKWNQLVQNGNFASTDGWTVTNGTITVSDNVAEITFTDTTAASSLYGIAFNRIKDHKYLCRCQIKLKNVFAQTGATFGFSGISNAYIDGTTTDWQTLAYVDTETANRTAFLPSIYKWAQTDLTGYFVKNLVVFDLTAIYGAGKEPTAGSEFFASFQLPYYAHNPGTLLSSKSSSVDFVKRNQCPALDTFFNVLPNTEYEVSGITAGGYLQEFDGNKTLIKTSSEITSTTDITLTAQTVYAKIQATTYTDVLCYITWETRGLPYAAYSKQTITLPNIELRSVGSVYDVLYQTGGGQRKVGYVNLGDCNWEYDDDNQAFKCMSITLPAGVQNAAINILCSKYESTGVSVNYGSLSNKHCTVISTTQTFVIKDTDYSSATAFKTSLDGVYLCYELATPTEITTTENPGWTEFAEIDNFGTVKFNQDPAQTIPVPQAYFVRYTVNLVEFLDSLFVHCGGDVSKIALVSP